MLLGSARSGGPSLLDCEFAGVDLDYLALLFEIVVNGALAVGNGEFGAAAQIHAAGDFGRCGVDDGRFIIAAIESEHSRGDGIENDAIRLLAGLDFGNGLQGLQVENRGG